MDSFAGFLGDTVSLLLPFIVWIVLAKTVDKMILFLEGVMNEIKFLPNRFSWKIAYALALGLSYLIAWQGNWSFFTYLDVNWNHAWQGYLSSAFLVASGSEMLKVTFKFIEMIPYGISGISSALRRPTVSRDGDADPYKDMPYDIPEWEDEDRYDDNI